MNVLLDTSVLVGGAYPRADAYAISSVSLAELHFGVLRVRDDASRASRLQRLAAIEARFEPLPVDAAVAREHARLAALCAARDANPRRRALDLLIAATANVHDAALAACGADFDVIADAVRIVDTTS